MVAIQALLGLYEKASSQMINSAKTTLFFSKNVLDATKESIKNLLGVAEIKEYEKYLGLPTVVGRNKKASLNYIKDRVWGKTPRVEGEVTLPSGQRSVVESSRPSHSHLCYELLSPSGGSLPRY